MALSEEPVNASSSVLEVDSVTITPDLGTSSSLYQDSDEEISSFSYPISMQKRAPAPEGRGFTLRALLVGSLVGTVIVFSNTYFGLQTGWISIMSMPASLLGFGFFKFLEKHGLLAFPFSPVENVLVQTVAGSMAVMPLGCGFVGVIPAISYLLNKQEGGPIHLDLAKSLIWAVGLCYFGVLFAVPLRKQVLIREKLRFPSGFSTAILISVLHGRPLRAPLSTHDDDAAHAFGALAAPFEHKANGGGAEAVPLLLESHDYDGTTARPGFAETGLEAASPLPEDAPSTSGSVGELSFALSWAYSSESKPPLVLSSISMLSWSFAMSGLFNLAAYFFPILRSLPIFGTYAASTWLWDLNPSPAYVGQGIIMGPEVTLHMLLGAVIGWGVLSPLAKNNGWAPGEVMDWESGSKGWIVWVSLAIMLADSIVSLGFIALQPLYEWASKRCKAEGKGKPTETRHDVFPAEETTSSSGAYIDSYTSRASSGMIYHPPLARHISQPRSSSRPDDAPPSQLISLPLTLVLLMLSICLCALTTTTVFSSSVIPFFLSLLSILFALLLSIMGVRALGQTDLNPVSGISKLSQLIFAIILPVFFPSSPAILSNIIAGAISEAGALQAGDLMQDLKTGHLLAASPAAQFWGQVWGATLGALVSTFVYRMYAAVYEIPSQLFQVPTAYVWVFTARLVTGRGLPEWATEFSLMAGILFAFFTALRMTEKMGTKKERNERKESWLKWIPGGIAVAVGMYNVPSFTLARAIGGMINWWWIKRKQGQITPLIILASGFILGEGVLSIVNLILQSCDIPHF